MTTGVASNLSRPDHVLTAHSVTDSSEPALQTGNPLLKVAGKRGISSAGRVGAVTKRSYKDQIVDSLKAAILSGELDPGHIYTTTDLVEVFDASRTPIREALLALEDAGLVTIHRGIGFQIVSPSPQDLTQALEIRQMIEIPVMRAVTSVITDEQLDQAEELMKHAGEAAHAGDTGEFLIRDGSFHLYLTRLHGNDRLTRIVENLRSVQRVPGLARGASHGTLLERHRHHVEILKAMRARDPEAVTAWMSRHLALSAELWNQADARGGPQGDEPPTASTTG